MHQYTSRVCCNYTTRDVKSRHATEVEKRRETDPYALPLTVCHSPRILTSCSNSTITAAWRLPFAPSTRIHPTAIVRHYLNFVRHNSDVVSHRRPLRRGVVKHKLKQYHYGLSVLRVGPATVIVFACQVCSNPHPPRLDLVETSHAH